ncbi:MAG: hypothetical protein J0I84_20350 [Terrimonas sp.]|nr:hypothetical protein [Terrimonas sp.]OJY97439.1 MAG: hypothetical protein BGP13_02100 [Sphingobacteriales bacterium 40-81]
MKTKDIIDELNQMTITDSEDYDSLKRIHELTDLLRQNEDGNLACEAMINLLERHPQVEFGTPGQPIHTIESYSGHYEDLLMKSLDRQPTFMTIWMLNRILNVETGSNRHRLIGKMKSYMTHPLANEQARETAKGFYFYQTSE